MFFLQVQCGCAHLHFHGSLLQLRGAGISSNPLLDAASGNVLLFNGQVFGGQLEVPALANDAQLLLHALCQPSVNVAAQLTGLRGPWALVFWQQATQTLWFGRDAIGVWGLPPRAVFTSVLALLHGRHLPPAMK